MRDDKKRALWRALQVFISSFITVAIIGIFIYVTEGRDLPVLNPSGIIADQQLTLILITTGLGVFVVIPVFILLFSIAWRYREGNKKAKYQPEMEGNKWFEALWWGIPVIIIVILAVITHISTHALDPYKPLESNVKPVNVQVVSLNWRWLFIYPDYNVATLNFMNIPKDTPINLKITADSPMNSFWVPALAGQVYSMTGMTTKLHIMANKTGVFNGTTANISGEGYAHMNFKVHSINENEFEDWAKKASTSKDTLTFESYKKIAEPNEDKQDKTFQLIDKDLFEQIKMMYMSPKETHNSTGETHSFIPTVKAAA